MTEKIFEFSTLLSSKRGNLEQESLKYYEFRVFPLFPALVWKVKEWEIKNSLPCFSICPGLCLKLPT